MKKDVILSIIFPGFGHFSQGRYWHSVFYILFGAACLDTGIVTLFVTESAPHISLGSFALYFVLWISALAGAIKFGRIRPTLSTRKMSLFKKGLNAYLKNDMAEAEEHFLQILAIDPGDADSNYALGRVYAAQDKTDLARRHFKRVLNSSEDRNGKWVWETESLLGNPPHNATA